MSGQGELNLLEIAQPEVYLMGLKAGICDSGREYWPFYDLLSIHFACLYLLQRYTLYDFINILKYNKAFIIKFLSILKHLLSNALLHLRFFF